MARPTNIHADFIIEKAAQVFFEKGISATEMKDIAALCGISRSSLYRYFDNKETLARKVLDKALKELYSFGTPLNTENLTGFEEVSFIFNDYINVLKSNVTLVRFLDDYDACFNDSNLENLDENFLIIPFNGTPSSILTAIKKGQHDNSIKKIENIEFLVAFYSNSLLAVAQRVLPRDVVLHKEQGYGSEYLDAQLNMILQSLKP